MKTYKVTVVVETKSIREKIFRAATEEEAKYMASEESWDDEGWDSVDESGGSWIESATVVL